MKINITLFLIFFGFIIIYTGCDSTTGIDTKEIPSSNVSFGANLAPVFLSKCANSGCHDDATKADGISLTSWVGVTAPTIVVPKDAENSRLVWSIERISGVAPMPPVGYSALTTNQIDGIKTWINEGAKNN